MLEHHELWLGPWSTAEPSRRAIHEAAGRQPLGQARWRPRPASSWRRWLTQPTLEVVETEDESLLLTVHRLWSWGSAWEVHDADERAVGIVAGSSIRDALGRCLALGHRSVGDSAWHIVSPEGPELAAVAPVADGCVLSFAPLIDDNPFLKMLLLALVLVPGA